MHTVVETPAYLSAADDAGMTDGDRERVVDLIAADPNAGDFIQGTGGCRKVRLAGRGKSKSGGYRIITYYADPGMPVFLLTVFGKGEKADLTGAERNGLAALTKTLNDAYRPKVVRLRGKP